MKGLKLLILIVFLLHNVDAHSQTRQRDAYGSVRDESELREGENIDEKIRKNFFLRAEVTKTTCYVGEPIMAIFKAYSRLDANSQVIKRPSLSGFSVIEMVDAYNNQPDIENYQGENYYVHLIRKVQLFPLQSGEFTLEPAEVESIIQLRQSGESGRVRNLKNLFRRNNADPDLRRQVIFKTPEVTVRVLPLPEEGQPADFSGAVGSFTVDLKMKDTVALQHEPSVVTMMIKGSGNFPLITDPGIDWPQHMDVQAPEVLDDINKYQYPLSGVKVFTYHLPNNDVGQFEIPPVKFSFFDPAVQAYKTAESPAIVYTVHPNDNRRKFSPKEIVAASGETPLHLYYFGIVAIVIVAVIVFLFVKKPK